MQWPSDKWKGTGWGEKDEPNCPDEKGVFLNGQKDYLFSDNDRDRCTYVTRLGIVGTGGENTGK